jgi:hypothetical protein
MLRPAFQIQSEETSFQDPQQYRLVMEVNTHSLSYVLLDLRRMSPAIIKYYYLNHTKDRPLEELVKEIVYLDDLFVKGTSEICLVYNFQESNIVPDNFFNNDMNRELTDLVYGSLEKGVICSEKIPWWELYNVYRLPNGVYDFLRERFTGAKCWHAYSLLLKSHKMFNAKEGHDALKVIFYTDKIIVLAFKKGQLQLIQTFIYQDVKDVVYHLLNCCQQVNLPANELALELSGLVDKHSALFNELMKYFMNISFEEIDESIKITDELKEYPLHYFSSLLKMAVCV